MFRWWKDQYEDWYKDRSMTGWQCPVCRRCYSPSVAVCFYCENEKTEKEKLRDHLLGEPNSAFSVTRHGN